MTEDQEIEFIIEEDENELNMYSYISNYLCFEYFVGYEITALLGYKDTNKTIRTSVSKCNQLIFKNYPGVKEPKLDPRVILITRDGAVEILLKTRKRISPDVLHILKKFNIDTTNRKCLTKEQQTLSSITDVFKIEKFEDQFKIGTYYLDLYFSEHKIVIECDENGHADRKPYKERERIDYVNKTLEIDDSHWIRFNPDEHNFDISKVVGQIYRKIDEIKQNKYLKIEEENKKKYEDEIRKLGESKVIEKKKFIQNTTVKCISSDKKKCLDCNEVLILNKFFSIDKKTKIFYDICISCYEKDNGESKQCSKCLEIKKKFDFVVDRTKKDSLTYECKQCRYDKNKKNKAENKEKNPNVGKLKCITCEKFEDLSLFYKTKLDTGRIEYSKQCKDCYCIENGPSKHCFTCQQIKILDEFDKTTANVDGLACYCKSCRKDKRYKEKAQKKR